MNGLNVRGGGGSRRKGRASLCVSRCVSVLFQEWSSRGSGIQVGLSLLSRYLQARSLNKPARGDHLRRARFLCRLGFCVRVAGPPGSVRTEENTDPLS